MTITAITGCIGSGKSVISQLLRVMGYPVYDTDSEAKRLMESSDVIRAGLIARYGEAVYAGGRLNKPMLAARIFGNPAELAAVNALVHPEVKRALREWALRQSARRCFFESAILFESGFESEADTVWSVSAPQEVRLGRAMLRDGATREQVLARMEAQLSQAEKDARADVVLLNDDSRALIPQVLRALTAG